MAASTGIKVHGLADLNRALKLADKETRLGVRAAQRALAEPVRIEAQSRAARLIPNIGVPWAQMRTGITTKVVYVAPKQRRKRGSKRPNLGTLLMDRAMEPALEQNRHRFEADIEHMLDRMAGHFNGGTLG